MLEVPTTKRDRSALPARQGGLDTKRRFAAKTESDQADRRRHRRAEKLRRAEVQRDLVARLLEAAAGDDQNAIHYQLVADKLLACGNVPLPHKHPTIHGSEGNKRHLAGMCHCAKAICPNCLPYADSKRVEKLQARAVEVAKLEGVQHFLLTVTLRHHFGAVWRVLVDALKAGWRKIGKQRFWREAVEGIAWKMETTFTDANGHHPHIHALVTLRAGVDSEEFASRLKQSWEVELRAAGRSCEWRDGWWQPLPASADLERTVQYIAKGFKEVLGTSGKTTAPWLLPAKAFLEIFLSMRQVKWFGTGGCWRSSETVAAESEEALEAERQAEGVELLQIPSFIWNKFTFNERLNIRSIIADNSLTHDQCIERILPLLAAQCTS